MSNDPFPQGTIHPYILCIAGSVLLTLLLLFITNRKAQVKGTAMWLFPVLEIPIAIICAKLFFVFTRAAFMLPMYGLSSFFRGNLNEYAFSGAILGTLLALFLTARITKESGGKLLDAFAAPGLFLIAGCRFSEFFVDFGMGNYVGNSALAFFPLSVTNEYGEWFQAIFMLEGIFALLALAFIRFAAFPASGDKGKAALTLWALPQVFSESMRNESLRWGFVRVQQIFCVVLAASILFYYTIKTCRLPISARSAWLPVVTFFAGVALCIAVEFALDKTAIPSRISYGVMAISLLAMCASVLRQMRAASSQNSY